RRTVTGSSRSHTAARCSGFHLLAFFDHHAGQSRWPVFFAFVGGVTPWSVSQSQKTSSGRLVCSVGGAREPAKGLTAVRALASCSRRYASAASSVSKEATRVRPGER